MAETQGALAVVARLKHGYSFSELKKLLRAVPFSAMSTVHYARFVVLQGDSDVGIERDSLVLSTNFDLPRDEHLTELREEGGAALDAVLAFCEDYPSRGTADAKAFERFVEKNAKPYGAFHIAKRFYSVQEILRERDLRAAIEQHLDEDGPWEGRDVHAEVRKFVASRGDLKWAVDEPPPTPRPEWLEEHYQQEKKANVRKWGLIGAFVVFGLGYLRFLEWGDKRKYEKKETYENDWRRRRLELGRRRLFAREETHLVANPLTDLSIMRPGKFRQVILGGVFKIIDDAANFVFYKGDLGGIPSIHFARWVPVDDSKRLLFMSNYDGSWESYLGDFVDQQSAGLTAVWSNTEDFPPTRFLTRDGASNEQAFKRWARDQQIRTDVWYAAYPDLTVQNVIANALIRRGVYELDADLVEKWQRLL